MSGFIHKNHFLIHVLVVALTSLLNSQTNSFYQLSAKTIDGNDFSFESLRGKAVIIVNTASKCGFTPQYEALEELYEHYKNKGLVIIGFPCNQFGKQESGSNSDIVGFCKKNYGVTFLMMEKIMVKGPNQHPVYKWLTQKKLNGRKSSGVLWNFQKYLINPDGHLFSLVRPWKSPKCRKIKSWLNSLPL